MHENRPNLPYYLIDFFGVAKIDRKEGKFGPQLIHQKFNSAKKLFVSLIINFERVIMLKKLPHGANLVHFIFAPTIKFYG